MILYLPIRKLLARRATTVIGAIPLKLNVQSLTTCADGIEDFSITILIPGINNSYIIGTSASLFKSKKVFILRQKDLKYF